jgi:hypothetical protein
MEALLGTLALFVFGGLATYTISERRHRERWWRFEQRPVDHAGAAYRRDAGPRPTRAVLVQHRAPATIRRTALWSIYMGQMAVPGGVLGLFGLLYAGIGLISIPGMILAIRIWRLGYAMLRRDANAEIEARRLHHFAVWLNVVAIGFSLVLMMIDGMFFFPLTLVLTGYGAVSFAHAHAMLRCAELLELDRQRRERAAHTPEPPIVLRPERLPEQLAY